MGLFGFIKKISSAGTETPVKELLGNDEGRHIQAVSEPTHNFQKDVAGLYPHEILMLSYAPRYKVRGNNFPEFWYYRYAVKSPEKLLQSLVDKGFLCISTAQESLSHLKVAELKKILSEYGLKISGSKDELVQRIRDNLKDDQFEAYVPDRWYCLTETGRAEVERNEHVMYMHSHSFADISLGSICVLVNKNPNIPYRDLIWGEFNRLYLEYAKKGLFGQCRNINFEMYQFLMEESRVQDAFCVLSVVLYYDLNSSLYLGIPPALIEELRKIESVLNYSDTQAIDILNKSLTGVHAATRRFTKDEVICVIVAYMIGHDEIAEKVINRKRPNQ